jgi:hypothetical protein
MSLRPAFGRYILANIVASPSLPKPFVVSYTQMIPVRRCIHQEDGIIYGFPARRHRIGERRCSRTGRRRMDHWIMEVGTASVNAQGRRYPMAAAADLPSRLSSLLMPFHHTSTDLNPILSLIVALYVSGQSAYSNRELHLQSSL